MIWSLRFRILIWSCMFKTKVKIRKMGTPTSNRIPRFQHRQLMDNPWSPHYLFWTHDAVPMMTPLHGKYWSSGNDYPRTTPLGKIGSSCVTHITLRTRCFSKDQGNQIDRCRGCLALRASASRTKKGEENCNKKEKYYFHILDCLIT